MQTRTCERVRTYLRTSACAEANVGVRRVEMLAWHDLDAKITKSFELVFEIILVNVLQVNANGIMF